MADEERKICPIMSATEAMLFQHCKREQCALWVELKVIGGICGECGLINTLRR